MKHTRNSFFSKRVSILGKQQELLPSRTGKCVYFQLSHRCYFRTIEGKLLNIVAPLFRLGPQTAGALARRRETRPGGNLATEQTEEEMMARIRNILTEFIRGPILNLCK
ncbi:hypothetical protein chiPu_0003334 [Chiloscyllium punctatum]|uniref:Uncharacterized protein n=1 Tax=Chiloscyllium punctatum TaxID=137246 RepID=A0A401S3G7_CHIPU|nr:hypothetical protein [Chiloscyllium punctatum]